MKILPHMNMSYEAELRALLIFEQQQSSMQMQAAVVDVDSVSGGAGLPVPRLFRGFEILLECFRG